MGRAKIESGTLDNDLSVSMRCLFVLFVLSVLSVCLFLCLFVCSFVRSFVCLFVCLLLLLLLSVIIIGSFRTSGGSLGESSEPRNGRTKRRPRRAEKPRKMTGLRAKSTWRVRVSRLTVSQIQSVWSLEVYDFQRTHL